jgi:glycosyltransferase involved in cell wall biosynthesis
MKILAFSKYLAFNVGGAEASTIDLLEWQSENRSCSIEIVSLDGIRFLGEKILKRTFPMEWKVNYIFGAKNLSRFGYYEYLLNRRKIIEWFSNVECDELWTYGLYAPAAIIGNRGRSKYFIRSETDLGIFGNYYYGIKKYAKQIYRAVEQPAINVHLHDLKFAIQNSTVVANSMYMAARAYEIYGVEAQVVYPPVDVTAIHKALATDTTEKKWVVFVGDSPVKGLHHVIKVARRLPDVNFRIVSRFIDEHRQDRNILWVPWESEPWRVYSGARLVIVPSQWEEAYGRVAREAYLLGIPVLVSAVGGLPEAVDEDGACLVEDYQSPEAWRQAIKNALSSAPSQRISE